MVRSGWMLFVDGENFTIRAQEFAKRKGFVLNPSYAYMPDTYFWLPFNRMDHLMYEGGSPPIEERRHLVGPPIRAHYYTSVQGDGAKMEEVRNALWGLAFTPTVFHKPKGRHSKGVDISLTTDALSQAYQDNYDVAVLVAGDGDYVPLVEEIKRRGKVVCVSFFSDQGLQDRLRLASDAFYPLDIAMNEYLTANGIRLPSGDG
jgi:hypothetical protein